MLYYDGGIIKSDFPTRGPDTCRISDSDTAENPDTNCVLSPGVLLKYDRS